MLEYFPANYVWNLATNIALAMGGNYGEIFEICRSLLEASRSGDDAGTEAFFDAWCAQADRLVDLASEDLAARRRLSAGAKFKRAAIYYITAERMQSRYFAPRCTAYRKMLESFQGYLDFSAEHCVRVEIPYEGKSLSGLFVPADEQSAGKSPAVLFCNGLDSTKEMVYCCGVGRELARRGVATLIVDQPGTGEALRLQELHAIVEAEKWASACVDVLVQRADVDADLLGIAGWSLGGFYGPRAAAFEKRFKLCVAWGANHDWGELQKRRAEREGDRPVPHYWDHVQWVWGQPSFGAFMALAPRIHLKDSIDRVAVPFLVTHGSNDRQIPSDYAQAQYDGAVNSPKRELKWFTPREGGIEHVSADAMDNARDYISDWIAATFQELGATRVRT